MRTPQRLEPRSAEPHCDVNDRVAVLRHDRAGPPRATERGGGGDIECRGPLPRPVPQVSTRCRGPLASNAHHRVAQAHRAAPAHFLRGSPPFDAPNPISRGPRILGPAWPRPRITAPETPRVVWGSVRGPAGRRGGRRSLGGSGEGVGAGTTRGTGFRGFRGPAQSYPEKKIRVLSNCHNGLRVLIDPPVSTLSFSPVTRPALPSPWCSTDGGGVSRAGKRQNRTGRTVPGGIRGRAGAPDGPPDGGDRCRTHRQNRACTRWARASGFWLADGRWADDDVRGAVPGRSMPLLPRDIWGGACEPDAGRRFTPATQRAGRACYKLPAYVIGDRRRGPRLRRSGRRYEWALGRPARCHGAPAGGGSAPGGSTTSAAVRRRPAPGLGTAPLSQPRGRSPQWAPRT